MSENIGSSKKRKAISATLAVAMTATMLLSGTLAYFYSATATNAFDGQVLTKEVVAHDDFNQETGNKDIYMENLGESTVYVRVKLTEDFRLNTDNAVTPTVYDPANTTGLPTGADTAKADYNHLEATGVPPYGEHTHALPVGAAISGTNYNAADDEYFHKNFFTWTMGGAGKTYLSAADKDAYHQIPEGQTAAEDTDGVYMGGDQKTVAQDTLGKGTTLKSAGGAASSADYIKTDIMPNAQIVTVAQYQQMIEAGTADKGKTETENTGYWIMDNSNMDGWYYWSRPLEKDDVTGLLLDQVDTGRILQNGDYQYDYHIHVNYEAVNAADAGIWLYGWNLDADNHKVDTAKASDAMIAILRTMGLDNVQDKVIADEDGNAGLPDVPMTEEEKESVIQEYTRLRTEYDDPTDPTKAAAFTVLTFRERFTPDMSVCPNTARQVIEAAKSVAATTDNEQIALHETATDGDVTKNELLRNAFFAGIKSMKNAETIPTSATKGDLRSLFVYNLDISSGSEAEQKSALAEYQRIFTEENFTGNRSLRIIASCLPDDAGAYLQNMEDQDFAKSTLRIDLNFKGTTAENAVVFDLSGFNHLDAIQLRGQGISGYKNLQSPLTGFLLEDTSISAVDLSIFGKTLQTAIFLNKNEALQSITGVSNLEKLRRFEIKNAPELQGSFDLRKCALLECFYVNNTNISGVLFPDNVDNAEIDKSVNSVDSAFGEGISRDGNSIANCNQIKTIDISKYCCATIGFGNVSGLEKFTYDQARQTYRGTLPETCQVIDISENAE